MKCIKIYYLSNSSNIGNALAIIEFLTLSFIYSNSKYLYIMKTKYMFKNFLLAITILRDIFSTVNSTVFNTKWHYDGFVHRFQNVNYVYTSTYFNITLRHFWLNTFVSSVPIIIYLYDIINLYFTNINKNISKLLY